MEKQTWLDKLMKFINMAGNAILMNLLFLAACLPVVTIGQAWCALLTAIRYNIRGGRWFEGFKFGFKTRFWRGIICWCICAPVCLFFFGEMSNAIRGDNIVDMLVTGVFFAFPCTVTVSLLILNVYIPTSVNEWTKNAINLFCRPLELLASAALFWAPVIIGLLWSIVQLTYWAIIVLAVYYTLAALVSTMLLKNVLVQFLLDARANGTLIAEEGANAKSAE